MEGAYFTSEHGQAGNVFRGFEGFLSSKEALRKRGRAWKPEDRLFSLSSRSSPIVSLVWCCVVSAAAIAGGGGGGRRRRRRSACPRGTHGAHSHTQPTEKKHKNKTKKRRARWRRRPTAPTARRWAALARRGTRRATRTRGMRKRARAKIVCGFFLAAVAAVVLRQQRAGWRRSRARSALPPFVCFAPRIDAIK